MLGDVLRTYASNELTRAFDCLAWRGARFHAGVHQARKSLRRTRASLALDARALGPGGMLIDRALRRINRSLSVLRDARAVVATLERLAKEHNAAASSSLLQRARHIAVQKRLAQARGARRDDPDFSDKRAVLAVLAAGLQALLWPAVLEHPVLASLRIRAAKANAASKRALSGGSAADWHRWRRRARRPSHQYRALGGRAAPRPEFTEQHTTLAVVLGEAQDYGLLLDHCDARSPLAESDRKALQALAKNGARRVCARIVKIVALQDNSGCSPGG
jgi:hypothetical protein